MRWANQTVFIAGFNQQVCDEVSNAIRNGLAYEPEASDQYDYYIDEGHIRLLDNYQEIPCSGFDATIQHRFSNKMQKISVVNMGSTFYKWMDHDFTRYNSKTDRGVFLFCFEFNDLLNDFLPFEGLNDQDNVNLKLSLQEFFYNKAGRFCYTLFFSDNNDLDSAGYFIQAMEKNNRLYNGIALKKFIVGTGEILGSIHYLRLPTMVVSKGDFSLNFLYNYF